MRLGVLADAFEFVDALKQLGESLPMDLTAEGALAWVEGLPPALEQHPSMEGMKEQLFPSLVKKIEEYEEAGKWKEARVAAGALAGLLGPVADMLNLSEGYTKLRDDVLNLPLCVFRELLASDALQLQSENETYLLLFEWVHGSPHVGGSWRERNHKFSGLVRLLRFHHMTLDFVANVVCGCSLMRQSGLFPSIEARAPCVLTWPPPR